MSKLVIFDLDGVLVEAKEIHFDALNSSLKNLDEKYVISWEEHLRSYDGLKTYDKLKLLSKSKGLPLDKDVQDKIFADKQLFTSKALNNLQINETLSGILSTLK
jgi:beta-phosphoglucomutase-like phosphatase (HAD superfamily)